MSVTKSTWRLAAGGSRETSTSAPADKSEVKPRTAVSEFLRRGAKRSMARRRYCCSTAAGSFDDRALDSLGGCRLKKVHRGSPSLRHQSRTNKEFQRTRSRAASEEAA